MTFTKADTRKVKGMAIIMMVLHHSFMMPERYKGMNVIFTPFAEEQFNWICWSFKICVAVFTFLSAFGITLSYKQENASYDLTADQTQRLILARALYKDAPFVFLDEPTAALDPLAEEDIYRKYGEFTKGKSSLFISHRLASTRFCDRILMIADGKIAEEGTHEELIKKGGIYAELFEVQAKYYQEDASEGGDPDVR